MAGDFRLSLAGTKVVVGFHHYGTIVTSFGLSMMASIRYEGTKFAGLIHRQGPYVDEARNQIVAEFLNLPYGDFLLMVDADIEFPEDSITRTLFIAESLDVKVVWGNYALGHAGNSIFAKDAQTDMFVPLGNLQKLGIYRGIAGGGTGWLLVHRSVLAQMKETFPGPWHWFGREVVPDKDGKNVILGEDLTFGLRCHKLGVEQVGYTGLLLVHHKLKGTVPDFMEEWATQTGYAVVSSQNPYQKEFDKTTEERQNADKVETSSAVDPSGGLPDPNQVLDHEANQEGSEHQGDEGHPGVLGREGDCDQSGLSPLDSD